MISYFQAYYQSYSITGNTTNSSCLDANRHYRKCRQDGPNPYYGSISFDNIAMAWVFIYQVISYLSGQFPARIFLIKVSNVNIRTMCGVVMVSLLLPLNRFHTLFWYFRCWLWLSKYQLSLPLQIRTDNRDLCLCTTWKHQKRIET